MSSVDVSRASYDAAMSSMSSGQLSGWHSGDAGRSLAFSSSLNATDDELRTQWVAEIDRRDRLWY